MKQLDPKSVWLFFFGFLFRSLPAVVVFGYIFWMTDVTLAEFNLSPWILVVAYIVFCYIWARLSYHFYRYELTDLGFKREYGVIFKRYVTIPYEKIQNVDIYRGLLARILGLSDLQIQTAGMSAIMIPRYGYAMGVGAEGRLPGISREVAEQLRDELVSRAKGPNQGV